MSEVRLRVAERQQLGWVAQCADDLVGGGHPVRLVAAVVEKLDVSKFYECIKAREGVAGRDTTDPRLLVSLWLYACIRGIGSARELARRCAESAPCACNRSSELAKAKPQHTTHAASRI
jgi:transposase